MISDAEYFKLHRNAPLENMFTSMVCSKKAELIEYGALGVASISSPGQHESQKLRTCEVFNSY
jgi:hypothetical protein